MTRLPPDLPRFLILYAALFAAFGVVSPFFAAFLSGRGLGPEAIGIVLAAGTATRLLAGPAGGRAADRLGTPRLVLVAYAAAAAAIAFGYLPAQGVWAFLLVSIAHAATLAPMTPIADALTLKAAADSGRFEYGWVRAAGSAAFIAGTLVAGQAVARAGLDAILWLNGALLGLTAFCAWRVPDRLVPALSAPEPPVPALSAAEPPVPALSAPEPPVPELSAPEPPVPALPVHAPPPVRARTAGVASLLRLPAFRRLMLVAALIQGSHALHDGFVAIHWRSLGIGDGTIGALWSESVAAEVVVFLLLGPWLLHRIGPAKASVLSACGGILRWGVLAATTSAAASALVEPLHGLTFALQHLVCMRVIAAEVPPHLAATAQAFYGTVAVGVATVILTLGSGPLYAHWGAAGFWVMAALCAAAIPLAWRLP